MGRVSSSQDHGYTWTVEWGDDIYGDFFCLNTDTNQLYMYVNNSSPEDGVWTSSDGSLWTQITSNTDILNVFHYSPLDGYYYSLFYGPPLWDGIPLRSPDAINWVAMTIDTPNFIYDYEEFNGELYACGRDGGNGLVHKLTGTTWNLVYTIDYPTGVECLCLKEFNGYLYVGVGVFQYWTPHSYSTGEVHRTTNGVDWSLVGTFDFGPNPNHWSHSDITNLEVFENKLYAVSVELYETENGTDWTNLHRRVGNESIQRSTVDDSFVYFTSFQFPYR